MNSPKPIYVTLIFLSLIFNTGIHPVSAIRCFNCSSHSNPDCSNINPSENSSFLEDCPQENAFCRKTYQTIISESLTIVTRGCGWVKFEKYPDDYCMVTNTNFKKETSCQCFTEACNRAVGLFALDVLFLSGVFVLISLSSC